MRIFLVCFLISFSAFANVVQVSSSVAGVRQFEADVNRLFPKHFAQVLKKPVQVEFVQLDDNASVTDPCLGGRVLARTKFGWLSNHGKVYLHSGFLPYIRKASRKSVDYQCGHKNFYKLAVASVLHEVTHIYDRSPLHLTKADLAQQALCQNLHEDGRPLTGFDSQCRYYLKAEGKISESINYHNLLQFSRPDSENKNAMVQRSVDPYEMVNPGEHFAVNMEYFLLDPQFQCRRPSLYQYLSNVTRHKPFAGTKCEAVQHVLGSVTQNILPLDPKRVYQVHYLFASKGEATMSKWGHAMFRVIMCADHRTEVGPDCLKDVSKHIVFSYRANIADIILSYWDGLTGKYPSQLLAFSMNEIVEEYNRNENRDLISLPLKISESEKDMMVKRLLEQYWSYSGKYYFLTNNCSHETDQIIRGALNPHHPYHGTVNMTPLAIYRNAHLHGLTDPSLIENKSKAIAQGYFFESLRPVLEQAFDGIKAYTPYKDVDTYLNESTSEERVGILPKLKEKKLAANLYILEKQIYRMIETHLDTSMITMILEQQEKKAKKGRLGELMDESLKYRVEGLPWKLAHGGYGLPLQSEMMPEEERQQRLAAFGQIAVKIREETLRLFPKIATEIDSSRQNLKTFFEYIRDLGPDGSSNVNNIEGGIQ